ncbi:MAG: TraR/DksA family transcriptional regulator [Bacteroidales bacterium]|jgi:RNA polymerase-binding transcription factor DksA|nr:TraR/DksA family transcriptional regulator [Bacteroidales bacterium]MBR6279107.1 TraR/DksA family transcriptional regulator [Bacteroidales bacterium]
MDTKKRYSDEELEEFKELILSKLEQAKKTHSEYTSQLKDTDGNQNISNTADPEDGQQNEATESASIMASRMEKYIKNLENALIRIENKTYGVDRITGELIPKERLKAVPHATLTVDSKKNENK